MTTAGPVANHIRAVVSLRPGIHFRGLGRAVNVRSVGQLRHHLDRLQRQRAIVEIPDGQFRRFFLPGQFHAGVMRALARLSRPMAGRVACLLLERPMRRVELRRRLRCADSTLGYQLARLLAAGDVRRSPDDPGRFELCEPGLVHELFATHPGAPPAPRPVGANVGGLSRQAPPRPLWSSVQQPAALAIRASRTQDMLVGGAQTCTSGASTE